MANETQNSAKGHHAARSNGPESAEGRAEADRIALRHGLSGHGVILPGETADQILERMTFLRPSYRPDDPTQEWLFVRICTETVRADHCLHRIIALRDEAATRAGESWDDDRALEAEELGAAIARKPELIRPKLLQSKHGARWLIAQWEELERRFELLGEWTGSASSRALDLLGVPIEARHGVWERHAAEGPAPLIRAQVDALRGRLDGYLKARDDRARADTMVGLAADGPDVRRVLRDESAALRRLQGWTRELRRLQNPASRTAGRGPIPSDAAPPADRPAAPPPPPPFRGPSRPEHPPVNAGDPPSRPNSPSIPASNRATPASPSRALHLGPSSPALNRQDRRALAANDRRSRRA